MTRFHPESPDIAPEALSKLRFVADFRKHLHSNLSKGNRAIYEIEIKGRISSEAPLQKRRDFVREALEAQPFFRAWSSMLLSSQDIMWRIVGQAVEADQDRMALRLKSIFNQAKGSVRLDHTVEGPSYLVSSDVHRMPGGYTMERDQDDLRAGALYDLGGAIYQLGIGNKAGGLLNDSRGHTIVAHLNSRFPGFIPTRILDMGCGVGHNTVPLASAFPEAEVVGIDVGAALVRYAHLRAEGLGKPIAFIQADAERSGFPDASFDLVVSQIVLHETSHAATVSIIRESRRLLKPGGVAIHLEVPLRADCGDDFYQVMSLWEEYYNAEPNISGIMDDDLVALEKAAGLIDVKLGYQAIPKADGSSSFTARPTQSPFAHWLVVSGRAPW